MQEEQAVEAAETAPEQEAETKAPVQSSILDFATKDDAEKVSDWTPPEGLGIPEHLLGDSADTTLEKLTKAYQGARRELSQKGKAEGQLEGAVPDSPDGYIFDVEGDDDKIAAELNSEASKPYVDAFRNAAHKLGIPDKAFQTLMREGLAGISEHMPLGVSDEDAAQISGEAEMEALVKEVGQREAQTIINSIGNYMGKLESKGLFSDEADKIEFQQMVGTARAARLFQRIMAAEFGERPIPAAIGIDGTVTPAEAQAQYTAALKMPEGAERNAALEAARTKMNKAFGTQPGGSIRSGVL